jgi:hypothetical protein
VGGATYTATASATSGLTVTFASGSTSVCTSSGTNGAVFTFVGPGTCVVNANQAGDSNWNSSTQQQTFAVKQNQTITFTAPTSGAVSTTLTLSATASSGLAVSYTLDATSTGCSLSSGVITYTGVGTCVINANQSGNGTYNAAAQVQRSITVVPRVLLANGGTAATADKGDTLTINFGGQVDATKFCTGWTNSGTQSITAGSAVTVTISAAGVLTVTAAGCTFGSVNLGTSAYGAASYSGNGSGSNTPSTVSLSTSGVLTVTLGKGPNNVGTGVAAASPSYTPPTGLAYYPSGTAIGSGPFTDPNTSAF